jgi:hypothetical protein
LDKWNPPALRALKKPQPFNYWKQLGLLNFSRLLCALLWGKFDPQKFLPSDGHFFEMSSDGIPFLGGNGFQGDSSRSGRKHGGKTMLFILQKKLVSPQKKMKFVASRAYLLIGLLCGRRLRSRALMSQAGLTIKHGGISLVIAHSYGKKRKLVCR